MDPMGVSHTVNNIILKESKTSDDLKEFNDITIHDII